MKNINFLLLALILMSWTPVIGQNPAAVETKATNVQILSIRGDTAYNIVLDKEDQIAWPGNPTEYSITSYKNVDFLKINPLQLESAGQHTEIYVSNTQHGVIIISSAEANDVLKDFSHTLELNPSYYETLTRQDTLIFSTAKPGSPAFDYTKASSINHDYKNAFNYKVDPRTGVSWSKGTYNDLGIGNGYGQLLYDIILWIPKK
jgi:hypothetical protein